MDEQSKTTSDRPASSFLGALILGVGAVVGGLVLLNRLQQGDTDGRPIANPPKPKGGDRPQVRRAPPTPMETARDLFQQYGTGVIHQVAQLVDDLQGQGRIDDAKAWYQVWAAMKERLLVFGGGFPPRPSYTEPPDVRIRNLNSYWPKPQ